ncbi:MAG: tRNA preQ1(34) S-adenosylmethionine ribosyltransferase-isomerase QueA [Phycisphaerae bacterium]
MTLQSSDFDYPLDETLIAQHPLERRDQSRLLALRRADGAVSHHSFADLPLLLREGDLLVTNDTRVIPASFVLRRKSGGKIEGLFCREDRTGQWQVMLKGAGRCRGGETLAVQGMDGAQMELVENLGLGLWSVQVRPSLAAVEILDQVGATPLPPYIRSGLEQPADRARYQTIFASRPGAVAAPTAGLHFTEDILQALARRGIQRATVTLHVGLGTFNPVKVEDLPTHKMHAEWYDLPAATAEAANRARAEGRRIVAVGTTSLRVLETVAAQGPLRPSSGWTELFLYPPARFGAVEALITNFHLPRSTLLMLVAAFCSPGDEKGLPMIQAAYQQAIAQRYRFFSYGDAMLIQ